MVWVLPVPGAEEQQAALQVLPGLEQRFPVLGHAEGVPVESREDGGGENDILPADAGRLAEAEADSFHWRQRHVEEVAAVDVELGAELIELGEHPLGLVDGQAGDLDLQLRLVVVRRLDHQDIPAALVGDQQQGQAQASQSGPRTVRKIGERGRGQPQWRQRLARHQLLQRQPAVMRRECYAADLHRPSLARRPRVDRGLQVDVLEREQFAGEHGMAPAIGSDEIADKHRNLIALPLANAGVNPVEEHPKRRSELAGLLR